MCVGEGEGERNVREGEHVRIAVREVSREASLISRFLEALLRDAISPAPCGL